MEHILRTYKLVGRIVAKEYFLNQTIHLKMQRGALSDWTNLFVDQNNLALQQIVCLTKAFIKDVADF